MNRVELFKIENTFALEGKGNGASVLILLPDFSIPKLGWKNRRESVTLVTPAGTRLEATAEFSLSHFLILDPDVSMDRRWRIAISLTDREKWEVPIGTALLVSPEIRADLLPPGPS